MFDDQETHYPVPGETPWERLRYLATSTETIYPVPPYVCMKCRRVIVPRKWALILARSGGIPRLFLAVWHLVLAVCRSRPGEIDRVAVHCAVPAVHARGSAAGLCRHSVGAGYTGTIRTRSFMPGRRRRAWPIWRFFLRMLPVIAIFILP